MMLYNKYSTYQNQSTLDYDIITKKYYENARDSKSLILSENKNKSGIYK